MRKWLIGIASLVGWALLLGYQPWLRLEMKIDSCLYQGGRWHYDTFVCEEDPYREAINACFDKAGWQWFAPTSSCEPDERIPALTEVSLAKRQRQLDCGNRPGWHWQYRDNTCVTNNADDEVKTTE